MRYWIHAKLKDGASSVGVETAKDALAKLAESEHTEVTAMDLSGRSYNWRPCRPIQIRPRKVASPNG